MRLTETCVRFRDIIAKSTELMRKLRLVINFEDCEDFYDWDGFQRCLKNRKYTSLEISNFRSYHFTRMNKLIAMASKLRKTEELKLENCRFNQNQFRQLVKVFLPNLRKFQLKNLQEYRSGPFFINFMNPPCVEWQRIQSNSIVEVNLEKCDCIFAFTFLDCHNLKRLSLSLEENSSKLAQQIGSFWEHASFKLENLEILDNIRQPDPLFFNFLRNQKELTSFSCEFDQSFSGELLNVFFQLDVVEPISVVSNFSYRAWFSGLPTDFYSHVNMSIIPHHQLKKFRFWTKRQGSLKASRKSFYWQYEPEIPEDMEAFERDVMTFLLSDSDIKGRKHCGIIESVSIGFSCRNADATLSIEFIAELIANLPNLILLKLICTTNIVEIFEVIKQSGRRFAEIEVKHPTQGKLTLTKYDEGPNLVFF